jgi:hypothetical protein
MPLYFLQLKRCFLKKCFLCVDSLLHNTIQICSTATKKQSSAVLPTCLERQCNGRIPKTTCCDTARTETLVTIWQPVYKIQWSTGHDIIVAMPSNFIKSCHFYSFKVSVKSHSCVLLLACRNITKTVHGQRNWATGNIPKDRHFNQPTNQLTN